MDSINTTKTIETVLDSIRAYAIEDRLTAMEVQRMFEVGIAARHQLQLLDREGAAAQEQAEGL